MSGNAVKSPIGTAGAIGLGLGSILGTGVFVSLAIATQIVGQGIFLALLLAAIVALCNGLSAAQLAAAHPVSGGTYAYGYRYLHPYAGFIAGWLFLLAKSASAATAALGLAGYLLQAIGQPSVYQIPIALMAVLLMTLVAACGLTKSNWLNSAIVGLTLIALGGLIGVAWLTPIPAPTALPIPFTLPQLGQATALMFVAYTGYGRITTMTEEVRDPQRSIPIAVVCTLGLTLWLYLGVAGVIVRTIGADEFSGIMAQQIPPLSAIAQRFSGPIGPLVSGAAMTAMLGVLLNLILGLSRVLMAMGRQGDMPRITARLNQHQTNPTIAVWTMGLIVAALVAIGNIKTTWSFSAFNVLIYYSLANLAALRLPLADRRYPQWIAIVGLVSCGSLAFAVEPAVWRLGLGLVTIGLSWKFLADRIRR
jgi:basic amino acid/polyamine antiporter, APA family